MRKPVHALAVLFEEDYGIHVELSYAGTNTLLGQIKLTGKGDIYIAGDADYIEMARDEGLVERDVTLCYFIPVILVSKGNPLGIKSLSDCLKDGIRLGVADEKTAAIGRLTPEILVLHNIDPGGKWKENLEQNTPTVNELGIAVTLGTLDAALVWNSIAYSFKDTTDYITIDKDKNIIPEVGAALLSCSENKSGAGKFLTFILSNKGKRVL
jgi:molybdate transport system substrate-binding protein